MHNIDKTGFIEGTSTGWTTAGTGVGISGWGGMADPVDN